MGCDIILQPLDATQNAGYIASGKSRRKTPIATSEKNLSSVATDDERDGSRARNFSPSQVPKKLFFRDFFFTEHSLERANTVWLMSECLRHL